jgi:hypothetical protein
MTREEHRAWRGEQIARWQSSGLTQVAFCKREGISLKSFQRWRRRLGTGAKPVTTQPMFVPVRVTGTRSAILARSAGARADTFSPPVEVVLGGGRRLRFGQGLDEHALSRLIRLLEVLPC